MARAKKSAPKGKGKPSEYERLVISKGNERKTRTVSRDLGVDESASAQRDAAAAAKADMASMDAREGDAFASRTRRVDWTPYKPTSKDIKKGVVQDPRVFKGDDAPYGAASSQQQRKFREADRVVRAATAIGDKKSAEAARVTMNKLGQFPGAAAGAEHACFGSGCANTVKPSESVLCPTCETRDSASVQVAAPSQSAVSRATVRTRKSA